MDGLINSIIPGGNRRGSMSQGAPRCRCRCAVRGGGECQSQSWLTSESMRPFVWGSMMMRFEYRWQSRNTNKGPITVTALPSAGSNLPPNDEPENRAGATLLVTEASMGHGGIPFGACFRVTARISSTHRGLPAHQPTVTSHPQASDL